MMKVSGLEINSDNYIDIQVEWRDPYNKKKFDSLADVAGRMIDIHYHDMKKNLSARRIILCGDFACCQTILSSMQQLMHSQHMSHGESSTMS